mgnify:CR=1 FL=1
MVGAKSVMRPPEGPVSKPLAVPFPAPRLGAGCQPLLWMIGSSASATAHLPAPPRASTKTRFRRWAKPKCWASRVRQATHLVGPSTTPALGHFGTCLSFDHLQKALLLPVGGFGPGSIDPSFPANPAKNAPNALSCVLRTPGTFSQRIQAGSLPAVDRRWSIASARSMNCSVRLPLSSARDCRLPATLKAWHGVPPQSMSASTIHGSSFSSVKSPWQGVSG